MNARSISAVCWLALIPLLGCGPETERQSIVLVTVDTLRAGNLHCYGYPLPTSPAVDALADEGLLFETCMAHASSTGPALASLLTGVYPSEAGVQHNACPLHRSMETLATALKALGYRTAAFVSNYNLRERMGYTLGFDTYDARLDDRELVRSEIRERAADKTTDAAIAWVKETKTPYFLWVHYQDPHGPYTPPESCLLPDARYASYKQVLKIRKDNLGFDGIPAYQAQDGRGDEGFYRSRYDGEILFFDSQFQRLLDSLARTRPLVVFTADHGESMGEHGAWFSHEQDLFNELIHVPLIFAGPGIPKARRADKVCHIDLFPTLLGLAGERDLSRFRGTNLLDPDLLDGPRPIYSETNHLVTRTALRSLIQWPWKLVRSPNGNLDPMLFDLEADPGETKNLLDDFPEEAERMLTLLLTHERMALSGKRTAPVERTAEDDRVLESLGYTGK